MGADRGVGLLGTYVSNTWLLNRLVADITQLESLITPHPRINGMNWILGHILAGRHEALELLGHPRFWEEDQLVVYRTGSLALDGEGTGIDFKILVDELERSQEKLALALDAISSERLESVVETRRGKKPVWEHIDGLAWHETFHVGQVDILRAYAHE